MANKEENREELNTTSVGWVEKIKNLQLGFISVLVTISSLSTMGILTWQDYQRPADMHFIPAGPTVTPQPTATPQPINVFINGAVTFPGIYELSHDARTQDLIQAASGFSAEAYVDIVNLAQPLSDGMHIHIPAISDEQTEVPLISTPPSATKSDREAANNLIDLNRATKAELETLPGVGPSTAQKILDYREDNGPFNEIKDVMDVSGIGPAKFEKMAEFITVDG